LILQTGTVSVMHQPEHKVTGGMAHAWRRHERRWKDNRFVYAVVSRRSRGVSIGINLNPDMACNFDCVYCQVDRSLPPAGLKVELERLERELDRILEAESDGSLYAEAPFNGLAMHERGLRDIAFSGNGEPTAFLRFEEAVRVASNARNRYGLHSAKLILLTNAAYLDKPRVRSALALMDKNNGEIWAKLDAGTEEYFRKVNRSDDSLHRILGNILSAAQIRPLVIQSLWFYIGGAAPPAEEIEDYCRRLNGLIASGGRIKRVQLYTIARDPAEASAAPLSDGELDRIASVVKIRVPVPLEIFYSA
jgi:wyosine [tRNA(Phe)-imidazoG37] synthetase (radical SAM superfamily)